MTIPDGPLISLLKIHTDWMMSEMHSVGKISLRPRNTVESTSFVFWHINKKRHNHGVKLTANTGLIMGKFEKIYEHILMRRSDANVPFEALCGLLKRLEFDERIKGDHHIFTKDGVEEILNLQPRDGKGKAYQVKQVREIILKYHLRLESQNGQEV